VCVGACMGVCRGGAFTGRHGVAPADSTCRVESGTGLPGRAGEPLQPRPLMQPPLQLLHLSPQRAAFSPVLLSLSLSLSHTHTHTHTHTYLYINLSFSGTHLSLSFSPHLFPQLFPRLLFTCSLLPCGCCCGGGCGGGGAHGGRAALGRRGAGGVAAEEQAPVHAHHLRGDEMRSVRRWRDEEA
jgi:hypothetical protein